MAVIRTALAVVALAALTLPAQAEDRSVLLNCKAMVEPRIEGCECCERG